MRESPDALNDGVVESLGHTVELQGVMHHQLLHYSHCHKALVEGTTKVFPTVIRVENLDGSAKLLCQCPGFKSLVRAESLCLVTQEVSDHVASGIVSECDEVPIPLPSGDG